ncbi:hypothetical protein BOSEA31B_14535 [Hyphomicrobiales bacterium]|nr:hypothetical protein BOSEA31B_14535 [Hyphomicrobiales bacterium]CAH1701030.1 hypothetical protein BOSEA1005_20729 [Hyphomicrobiales bacterium]CAI0344089.1 hypothetical protein BO1005MUT1_310118 [Hyphomicrobiales bacterium]
MALTTGLAGCASRLCGVVNRNIETFGMRPPRDAEGAIRTLLHYGKRTVKRGLAKLNATLSASLPPDGILRLLVPAQRPDGEWRRRRWRMWSVTSVAGSISRISRSAPSSSTV